MTDIKDGIHDFFHGCQGIEKLAFPIMRKQLSYLYQLPPRVTATPNDYFQKSVRLKVYEHSMLQSAVERFSLTVPNTSIASCIGNTPTSTLDGVLVYGRDDAPIENFVVHGHEQIPRNRNLPIVLYCPPNAGFYECIGMAPVHSNWVGVYSQLVGLDVCVFNYRCGAMWIDE
jgi:hypothetical protein